MIAPCWEAATEESDYALALATMLCNEQVKV